MGTGYHGSTRGTRVTRSYGVWPKVSAGVRSGQWSFTEKREGSKPMKSFSQAVAPQKGVTGERGKVFVGPKSIKRCDDSVCVNNAAQ